MALRTLGTNANNSLSALAFLSGAVVADMASLALRIKDDQINGNPIFPGAFDNTGWLYIPNRGRLLVKPGDYVGVSTNGWPILISANEILNGPWTHS